MVEKCGRLSDLPPEFPGRQPRRHRRLAGSSKLPVSAIIGRGFHLAEPCLRFALMSTTAMTFPTIIYPSRFRDDGRFRGTAGQSPCCRHQNHHGSGREPYERPASLVSEAKKAKTILTATIICGRMPRKQAAERLAKLLRRLDLDLRQRQAYFHVFAPEQPDLNWKNLQVREEIYRMIRWWLDLGDRRLPLATVRPVNLDIGHDNQGASLNVADSSYAGTEGDLMLIPS